MIDHGWSYVKKDLSHRRDRNPKEKESSRSLSMKFLCDLHVLCGEKLVGQGKN
jgi:hypothetical protein